MSLALKLISNHPYPHHTCTSDIPVHDPFLQEAAASKLMEQQQVRRQLVTLFLHLRATNERDRSKWAAVLDEAFVMTLPITPYRYFPRTGVNHSLRLVSGITGAMVDAASLQVGPLPASHSGSSTPRLPTPPHARPTAWFLMCPGLRCGGR